ncbi:MAG: hypothetical protein JSU03_09910 [Bacteroidetes bacterium]|nr:hypothetical protein [Bacteroidota bacterium]MBS1757582.1 hypothetical protein [Bacteroidota bacterium]
MKQFSLTMVTLLALVSSNAQYKPNGYYISQNNDTIVAKINFPKGFFGQNNFTNMIEVIESNNHTNRFTPKDIKGYGLTDNSNTYIFLSKPTKDGSLKFLTPVYLGNKASLYQYGLYTAGSGYSMASQQVFYTFEKPNNDYLFLPGRLTNKFKKELKNFFKENANIQQVIDNKLKYWLDMKKDLLEIMEILNK